jgi:hypothetical protein
MRVGEVNPMTGAIIAILGAVAFFADDAGDRGKIVGKWLDQGSNLHWLIEDKGDSIRIMQSQNDQQVSLIDCKIGSECQVKDGGRTAKITLYFNGPKLVEFETKGSETVKRRFSATDDAMEIEVIPIVPDGKTQVVKLKRVSAK